MLSEETHIYTFRKGGPIEIGEKKYANSWAVEDRVAGQAEPAGTMWLIDGPPKLVRWTTRAPEGSQTNIDQELAE